MAGLDGTEACDVAILGGGPAGASCAIMLARLGVERVVLCEAETTRPFRLGETIPPDMRQLLARLGVLEAFLADGHVPCHGSCSSWGSDKLGYNDFMLRPYGHGWHIDRQGFETMLLRQAKLAGAEVLTGARMTGAMQEDGCHVLTFRGAPDLRAQFVVDATGGAGLFARLRGARRQYGAALHCTAARFRVETPNLSKLTWIEAEERGWWYASRLPSDELLVMFASDADLVRQARMTDYAVWQQALKDTRHIGRLLDHVGDGEGIVRSWAAPTFCLDHVSGQGWAAVGDAASCYDPISSQGLYKAVSGALRLTEAVAARHGGATTPLEKYANSVQRDFAQYLDHQHRLYGLENRWSHSDFWRRRQHGPAVAGGEPVAV